MSFLDDERKAIERAPFLFSELPQEVQERVEGREQKYDDWTAARLFSQRREIYEVVVKMLGAEIPVRFISDVCAVSPKTVAAVRAAEPDAVTSFRAVMTKRRTGMIHRCADVIDAALEAGTDKALARGKDAAIIMNILDGQQRLDQGAPTQIVQINQPPAVDTFREWMKGVIDVTPQTGSEREERGAKGDSGGGADSGLRLDRPEPPPTEDRE